MDRDQLRLQVANMRKAFFDEGDLSDEKFIKIEELRDDNTHSVLEEILTIFITESDKNISNIEQALEQSPLDFGKMLYDIDRIMGGSLSLGAPKIVHHSTPCRLYCTTRNAEGFIRAFEQLKIEYGNFRQKLETYLELVKQVGQAENPVAPSDNDGEDNDKDDNNNN